MQHFAANVVARLHSQRDVRIVTNGFWKWQPVSNALAQRLHTHTTADLDRSTQDAGYVPCWQKKTIGAALSEHAMLGVAAETKRRFKTHRQKRSELKD